MNCGYEKFQVHRKLSLPTKMIDELIEELVSVM